MPRKSRLTVAQKTEVVLKLLRREESAAKLARRYGISENTLYRYRDQFLDSGKEGLANRRNDSDERIKELENSW